MDGVLSSEESEDEASAAEREAAARQKLAAMAAPRPAFGWEPPSSADGPHVGRSLAMVFGKQGVFFGLVTSFANGAYQVFYPADGKTEEVEAKKLDQLMQSASFELPKPALEAGAVELVLDRRRVAAAGEREEAEHEYLVQWAGRGHWHDAWISEEMALALASKKTQNFNRRQPKSEAGAARAAQAGEAAVPLGWRTVQRLIAKRHEDEGVPKGRLTEYLVKWEGLDYSHCSWERVSLQLSEAHLVAFEQRAAAAPRPAGKRKRAAKKGAFVALTEQPASLASGGKLYSFQLEALNWIRFSLSKRNNVILADEMGLGKTVVSMANICHLNEELGEACGPVLVVAPLSTLGNWEREAAFWAPHLHTVSYFGNQEARSTIVKHELGAAAKGGACRFDILLTSYELATKDCGSILNYDWECLIVDEGHNRLKNQASQLFAALYPTRASHRILLTGTPLQNNLSELKALLQFIQTRSRSVNLLDTDQGELTAGQIQQIRKVLEPHVLRRRLKDVHLDMPAKREVVVWCGLAQLQRSYLQWVLTRNFSLLNQGLKGSAKRRLMNVAMECRKACNHPYLFDNAEPDFDSSGEELDKQIQRSLVTSSGKFMMLDKMLPELRAAGHRVLIFSQMTRVLDLLEDFLDGSDLPHVRLDGNTSAMDRQMRIESFNKPESEIFCFLLSTRAGGQGINLATADTVIIFDSDFNPHMDLQALARAYRIGQRRDVMVYRLVTKGTIEERVVQLSHKKLKLEKMIVAEQPAQESVASDPAALSSLLKHGVEQLFDGAGVEAGQSQPIAAATDAASASAILYSKEELRKLLDRSATFAASDPAADEPRDEDSSATSSLMDSLKDARAWEKSSTEDEEDEDDDSSEGFWQRMLEERYLAAQPDTAEELGRGKRDRKQLVDLSAKPAAQQEAAAASAPSAKKTKSKKLKKADGDKAIRQDFAAAAGASASPIRLAAAAPAEVPAAPAGWGVNWDGARRAWYYWHTTTRQTQWHKPSKDDEPAQAAEGQTAPEPAAVSPTSDAPGSAPRAPDPPQPTAGAQAPSPCSAAGDDSTAGGIQSASLSECTLRATFTEEQSLGIVWRSVTMPGAEMDLRLQVNDVKAGLPAAEQGVRAGLWLHSFVYATQTPGGQQFQELTVAGALEFNAVIRLIRSCRPISLCFAANLPGRAGAPASAESAAPGSTRWVPHPAVSPDTASSRRDSSEASTESEAAASPESSAAAAPQTKPADAAKASPTSGDSSKAPAGAAAAKPAGAPSQETAPAHPPPPPTAAGWSAKWHEQYEEFYFVHEETGESSWTAPSEGSPASTGDAAATAAATDPDSVTERVPLPPVGWGLAFSDVHNRWIWWHLTENQVVLLNSDTEEAVESEAAQQAAETSAPVSPDATSSPDPGLNIKGDRRGKGKKICSKCLSPNAARQRRCVECGHDFYESAEKQKNPQAPEQEQEQEAASAEREKAAKEDVEGSNKPQVPEQEQEAASAEREEAAKKDVEESTGSAKEPARAAKDIAGSGQGAAASDE